MATAPEALKIASTTVLDAFSGRAIATGLEMAFPDYDPSKRMWITVLEAAAQIAASGLLAVQLGRFLYSPDNVDATAASGLVIFLWEQPKLKAKVAGIEHRIIGKVLSPALGNTANTRRGAGTAALQNQHMAQ